MRFPYNDRFWSAAADFIRLHMNKEAERVIAPMEFGEPIGKPVQPFLTSSSDLERFHWAVIHKGRLPEMDQSVIRYMHAAWTPVFANEVFVVFAAGHQLPAVDVDSPHLRSFDEQLSAVADPRETSRKDTSRIAAYLGGQRLITRTVWGHKIILDTRDVSLTPHLIMDGYWEMWITKAVLHIIHEGMTVIDVGANVGYYSLLLAEHIGSGGRLYSFEANPELAEILFRNMEINGFLNRSEVVNKAVYSSSGPLEFNQYDFHKGSSSLWADTTSVDRFKDKVTKIQVDGVSLDDYFAEGARVNFIKVDAEGAEPLVVQGAQRVLRENPEIMLVMEFAPAMLNVSGSARGLLDQLLHLGFRLHRIEEDGAIVSTSVDRLLSCDHSELFLDRV